MSLYTAYLPSPPIPPFSSSSSPSSSNLFLLMIDFQTSWYYALKILMKIRYEKVPGCVISLVLPTVLITDASSYLFTIIFTYPFVYIVCSFVFFYLAVHNCILPVCQLECTLLCSFPLITIIIIIQQLLLFCACYNL